MDKKKNLAKLALAALVLAAAQPAVSQAHFDFESKNVYLAKGCGAACGSVDDNKKDDVYSSPSHTYQVGDDHDSSKYHSTATTVGTTLTETQLLAALNPQGRSVYLSLDSEGKALAIQLASQDSYTDKNLAVKDAQKRMNERHAVKNR